jgi:hypothetical protein
MMALATGCSGDDGKPGETGSGGTGGPVPAACETVVATQEAALTDVPMVVRVTFSTDDATTAKVIYREVGGSDLWVVTPEGTLHETLLRGLPPISDFEWYVVLGSDVCPTQTFRTGAPVVTVPATVAVNDESAHAGGYIVGANVATTAFSWVLRRDGKMVWQYEVDAAHQGTDARSAIGRDGISMNLYNVDRSIDDGEVRTIGWDGAELASRETPSAHHAFRERADDSVEYLSIDVRTELVGGETRAVVGDVLRVLEADGTIRDVWNVWDHPEQIPLEDHGEDTFGFYPQGWDWTHANGFDHDTAAGRWLVTMRNVNTVLEVDETGAQTMSFGAYGDWTLVGLDVADIKWPHNSNYTEDGTILTFISPGGDAGHSKVVELVRDDAAKTLTVLWEVDCQASGGDQKCLSRVEGAAERLSNGNTLVSWGAVGLLQEIAADKAVVWEAGWAFGHISGHVHLVEDLYEVN